MTRQMKGPNRTERLLQLKEASCCGCKECRLILSVTLFAYSNVDDARGTGAEERRLEEERNNARRTFHVPHQRALFDVWTQCTVATLLMDQLINYKVRSALA